MLLAFAVSFSFAEEKTISFGETNLEEVMIVTNNSQKTKEKQIALKDGLIVYTERVFPTANSSLSIVFIEQPVIENAGDIKAIQLKGKSYGYVAAVKLHLSTSSGEKRTLVLCQVPVQSGDYVEKWENPAYLEKIEDRQVQLTPVWPFNEKNLYIDSIEFHMNGDDGKYPYNTQKISEISFIFDKANADDGIVAELDEVFDVTSKEAERQLKRKEKLKAEKKAAEDIEKSKMATESFDN